MVRQGQVQNVQDPVQGSTTIQSQATAFTSSFGQNAISNSLTGSNGLDQQPTAISAGSQSDASSVVSSLNSSVSEKSSTTGASRSAHGTGKLNPVQHEGQLSAGLSSSSAVDASALAREVAAASGSASTNGASADHSTSESMDSVSSDAFAALDSADSTGSATWIHTGTQRAEAGYQDPELGWISIRADTSGGQVHAELVTGSSDAAQALGSHLDGLNSYLAERHTPVETLTLSSSDGGWTGADSSAGQGQQGAGQQTGQQLEQGTAASSSSGIFGNSTALSATASAAQTEQDSGTPSSWLEGGHISVMA